MADRREFTRKQRLEIWNRAKGHCEACNAKLKVGEGEYDHRIAQGYGGENTTDNGQLLCRVCHGTKTGVDKGITEKVKRIRDKHHGIVRPKGWFSGGRNAKLKKKINGGAVVSEEMVELAARKLSRKLYPSGDGSKEDEAWHWSDRFDHPGNQFEHECRAQDIEVARAALSAVSVPGMVQGWQPTHRHKKRGTTYRVLSESRLQVDGDLDNEKVVIYQGEDGQIWVRVAYEFNDGRFEALAASPALSNGERG